MREDVVLNLAGVTFIDSSGLRALLLLRAGLEAAGRDLMLINPSERVLGLLDLTATRSAFEIVTARPLAAQD